MKQMARIGVGISLSSDGAGKSVLTEQPVAGLIGFLVSVLDVECVPTSVRVRNTRDLQGR